MRPTFQSSPPTVRQRITDSLNRRHFAVLLQFQLATNLVHVEALLSQLGHGFLKFWRDGQITAIATMTTMLHA